MAYSETLRQWRSVWHARYLCYPTHRHDQDDDGEYSFGIFSVKFSTDGRELVAASSDDSIYVYDLEAKRLTLSIPAHASDVNAVCFADESGHLIYSGSDDNLCKVWDRRRFVAKGQAAGVLTGHIEGITFIDSRGDGRYFISNGKDQAFKLWDIRKMSSNVTWLPLLNVQSRVWQLECGWGVSNYGLRRSWGS